MRRLTAVNCGRSNYAFLSCWAVLVDSERWGTPNLVSTNHKSHVAFSFSQPGLPARGLGARPGEAQLRVIAWPRPAQGMLPTVGAAGAVPSPRSPTV